MLAGLKGKLFDFTNDPPNYEILMNLEYVQDFGFVPSVFCYDDKK